MEHLWNIVPTDSPISTVDLTGDELRAMLEANLERTYSSDPYCQMGGFVKRCRGLNMYFKMENPKGHRIEDLLIGSNKVEDGRIYRAAMLGEQGVPMKYGSNRKKLEYASRRGLAIALLAHPSSQGEPARQRGGHLIVPHRTPPRGVAH